MLVVAVRGVNLKKRKGFISNSSSCSFLVTVDQSPAETDKKLQEIIDFHNKMTGENHQFSDIFNPSFTAEGEFAKRYEEFFLEHDYGDWRKNLVKDFGGVEGQTIIYPKIEDHDIPFREMIDTYANSLYDRKDDGIGEFLK